MSRDCQITMAVFTGTSTVKSKCIVPLITQQLVEAPRYKLEGRGFDSRLSH